MAPNASTSEMSILYHQDGGTLSFELPEPLPPLIVKLGYCISGDAQFEGGQLRVIPGSHRLVGPPVMKTDMEPHGAVDVNPEPGDVVLLDWRCWHAVGPNKSQTTRRNLYFAFGPRWLMPMDYEAMPKEFLNISSVAKQLLGGKVTSLGYYLPTAEDVPLRAGS